MRSFRVLTMVLLLSIGHTVAAQVLGQPVDTFEKVRWGMNLAELRLLARDSPLVRLVPGQAEKAGRAGIVTFQRNEIVFDKPQSVLYRLQIADSSVTRVFITWVHAEASAEAASRVHDSLWAQILRRYGPASTRIIRGAEERQWTTTTTTITAVRVRGLASGVFIMLRPLESPP